MEGNPRLKTIKLNFSHTLLQSGLAVNSFLLPFCFLPFDPCPPNLWDKSRKLPWPGSSNSFLRSAVGLVARPNRLLKNAHLLRFPHPSSLRRTAKYASFLRISGASHLGIFEQPEKNDFSRSLIKNSNGFGWTQKSLKRT